MLVAKYITYRELMIYYGITAPAAQRMMAGVRFALNKKRDNRVHIQEFCDYENVKREIFESELDREFRNFKEKSSKNNLK